MDKTIEIENLQQEVARLTAEAESLKGVNQDLNSRKDMWYNESEKWRKKYDALVRQVQSLATIAGGMVEAA